MKTNESPGATHALPEVARAGRGHASARRIAEEARTETPLVRRLLIGAALAFLGAFVVLPLAVVFRYVLQDGWGAYWSAISDPIAMSAIRLTLLAAVIAVPMNLVFGVAAAWAIAKFEFRGKQLLVSLIDLPFSISPIIAGLIFVLIFGAQGWLGPWLMERDLRVVFAVPGIVLVTIFVTLPFVARELIPLMSAQGTEEEEAALTLGAGGWQTFRRVTLPNIRWGLLYGLILCNARALGDFGAVSVVSGHIRGLTNTMTLHVFILYNEYHTTAAFALASLLTLLALGTLAARSVIEWRIKAQVRAALRGAPSERVTT